MSSIRKKIIFHIGLPKTGTTTIQNVLYANRDLLLWREGVLYPSLMPNLSTPLRTIFQDNSSPPIASRLAGLTEEEAAARRKEYLNSLETEVSSREWNTLLLSAEGVSNMSEPDIAKLREWGEQYSSEWTVLVCVRHPLDWTRGMVQLRLQQQGDTLDQIYEKPPLPGYRAKISNAISVFGKENVRVFDFEGALEAEGGIVGNFADLVGLSAPSRELLVSKAVRDNVSLSMESARILNSLNRQRPRFVDGIRAPLRAGPVHELPYFRRIKGRKFDVPEAVKENVLWQSQQDISWLNGTFNLDLYGDVMDFSPHAESHQEEPMEVLSDAAIESIAEVLGELMTENAFRSTLDRGKVALGRGNLERAAGLLREAARLDPDAPQPKKLLEEIAAKKRRPPEKFTDEREGRSKAVGKAIAISSRLVAGIRRDT